jgi:hypothetical protein
MVGMMAIGAVALVSRAEAHDVMLVSRVRVLYTQPAQSVSSKVHEELHTQGVIRSETTIKVSLGCTVPLDSGKEVKAEEACAVRPGPSEREARISSKIGKPGHIKLIRVLRVYGLAWFEGDL